MMNRRNIYTALYTVGLAALLSSCAAKRVASDARPTPDTTTTNSTVRSGTAPVARVGAAGKIQTVNPQQFNKLLLLEDIQLVDVRTPEEYASGHIEDAININVNGENFDTEINKLDKDKPVLVYCRSGKRSMAAAEKLREKGFTKIVNLDGGMLSWEEAELPTNK